ncbi:hypothetical protein K438DRAFT_1993690 [Mycena galopus ATCC 62051]|nr:hypothetical protein K438DRAFT_1993690 [Mycena galopus ATCC 62051]
MTLDPKWAFFFQPVYQSTDESDDSDVIDPDTDTERTTEIQVAATRKPWKSRPPIKPKIPRSLVYPPWLVEFEEEDTPSRIQDEEDVTEQVADYAEQADDEGDGGVEQD